ncbi:CidA/LrgA family protein [Pseudoalteromonas ruthenica]|nr:CidA/LrgA family protein [Pseudoalteromonas ruthenica]
MLRARMIPSMSTNRVGAGKKIIKHSARFMLSTAIINAFLFSAHALSDYFSVSFPAPLSAMLALFLALQLGIVKLHWLTSSAHPLLNYMPLFFVPAAAAIIEHVELVARYWLPLLLCLVIVPLIGLFIIGTIMQRLGKEQ